MPRPLPASERPAWRVAAREAYLDRVRRGICVRPHCGRAAAVSRYGRPGVFCAGHRDAEQARVAARKAGVAPTPAAPKPPALRTRRPKKPGNHRRRDMRRGRRRLIATLHHQRQASGAPP